MTPLHISDPVLPHRDRKRKKSSFMSGPMMVMAIAAVAGIPPIANRLVTLDATVHANNDAIVSFLLAATPYFFIAVAAFGLWVMFGPRRPAVAARSILENHDSGFYIHGEGRS